MSNLYQIDSKIYDLLTLPESEIVDEDGGGGHQGRLERAGRVARRTGGQAGRQYEGRRRRA